MSATRLVNLESLKALIKERLDVSDVAEILGVDLHPSGQQMVGLCPLHSENTPSFYVNDNKGVYKCWGCKAGGDAIDLIERGEHLDFFTAIYRLAEIADIDISEYERPLTDAERQVDELRSWCEQWLAKGKPPSRGDRDVAEFYKVHECWPPATVPSYFIDKTWMLDGVVFPYYRGNQLVGWRLREHPGQEKRAIGTPSDFLLGKVTEVLFGLTGARDRIKDGHLVVVEGEYDQLEMHAQTEFATAAMGGSNLTAGQLQQIKDHKIRKVTLLFDGDDAGRKAARAHADRLWAEPDLVVHIAVCHEGYDPEDMTREYGPMPVGLAIEYGMNALEYALWDQWIQMHASGRMTDKLDFIRWITDTYGAKLSGGDYSVVLGEVARWMDIPELDVRDFVRGQSADLSAIESERMLLGRALRDKNYYLNLRQKITKDDLFMLRHQRIWDILETLLIEGHEFDPATIEVYAQKLGVPIDYLHGTLETPEANLEFHLGRVTDLSLRRSARDDALAFKDRITDLSTPAELVVGDLTARVTQKALRKTGADVRQLGDQVDEAMDQLHVRMQNPSGVHGMDLGTQLPRTTQMLQGIQDKRLILVSAISGVGKSSLMIAWCGSLAVHQSIPIDFISLEMDETEILYKLCAHMTQIDSMKISGGRLEPNEARRVEYAMARIRKSPLHIWAPDGLSTQEFVMYAQESVLRRRTQAFFLDYVQLIDPDPGMERENGYVQYGHFGRMAKMKVARGMEVAVVCAAQLNRNASTKERPTKEDMGDSYALVRHSDVIMILAAQEDSTNVDLWIDKNRQGPGNQLMPIQHNKPTNTFHEVSGGARTPEYLVE